MKYRGEKILLLQGPMGPFFWWLARKLRRRGATIYKINFNLGDLLFYPLRNTLYRKPFKDFSLYLEKFLQERNIQQIALFGDCRPYHQIAVEVAKRLGVRVLVFEEGYLRPYWITLEEEGVNGNSGLLKCPKFYQNQSFAPQSEEVHFRHHFGRMAVFSTLYALAKAIGSKSFPEYRHHRSLNPLSEAFFWLRSAWRKRLHKVASKQLKRHCKGSFSKKYYLLPLQVHNDAQIQYHSSFRDIEALIKSVVKSFANDAPKDLSLVIKHHPMDRGYSDYTEFVKSISQSLEVSDRVIYAWDSHLPTLLSHSIGVVTANSTAGLQALYHGVPVKVLGHAIYDIPGLTSSGSLEQFWEKPLSPDPELYIKFRNYLLATNQVNGSFSYPPTQLLMEQWMLPQKVNLLLNKPSLACTEHQCCPFLDIDNRISA